MLKFNKAKDQAKLKEIETWLGYMPNIYSFSLPSGHTCPFALDCLSKADRITGKITDGLRTLFRCFQASIEAISPTARKQYWDNFDQLKKLKNVESMVDLIMDSMPSDLEMCRVHVGGDFFNERYFQAWLQVGKLNPDKTFYAYTKSIPYWVANMFEVPSNFILNASRGGRRDYLIDEFDLKVAEVVFSIEEAEAKNLPIDHTEEYAIRPKGNFALLLHGQQPKGSKAQEAKKLMDKQGVKYAYKRKEAVAV